MGPIMSRISASDPASRIAHVAPSSCPASSGSTWPGAAGPHRESPSRRGGQPARRWTSVRERRGDRRGHRPVPRPAAPCVVGDRRAADRRQPHRPARRARRALTRAFAAQHAGTYPSNTGLAHFADGGRAARWPAGYRLDTDATVPPATGPAAGDRGLPAQRRPSRCSIWTRCSSTSPGQGRTAGRPARGRTPDRLVRAAGGARRPPLAAAACVAAGLAGSARAAILVGPDRRPPCGGWRTRSTPSLCAYVGRSSWPDGPASSATTTTGAIVTPVRERHRAPWAAAPPGPRAATERGPLTICPPRQVRLTASGEGPLDTTKHHHMKRRFHVAHRRRHRHDPDRRDPLDVPRPARRRRRPVGRRRRPDRRRRRPDRPTPTRRTVDRSDPGGPASERHRVRCGAAALHRTRPRRVRRRYWAHAPLAVTPSRRVHRSALRR